MTIEEKIEQENVEHYSMDTQSVDPQYIELYRRHWSTIHNSVKRGVFKDVYHYVIYDFHSERINGFLTTIRDDMGNRRFKINAAFGFILENRSTEELKFFHPSNNNKIFETPRLVGKDEDFEKLSMNLERADAFEYASLQRPDTHWVVKKVICVRFDVTKM